MSELYKCYGCSKLVEMTELRYCDENNDLLGVCKVCIKNKTNYVIPPSADLTWIHDLTPEYKSWFSMIDKECPGWITFNYSDNSVEVTYYCGPHGETGDEYHIPEFRKRKEVIFPPKKTCYCCD